MKKHNLEHLENLPLWQLVDESRNKAIILKEQGVEGLYQHLFCEGEKGQFLEQKRRNLHFYDHAIKFYETLGKLREKTYFLKGVCFLGNLYPFWGERFMSDIDIYCSDMDSIEEAALSYGLQRMPVNDHSWLGNKHKKEYFLETSLGVIPFEFHSKLFWHIDDPHDLKSHSYSETPGLGLEECLVFLIGHYAFQHTCQKLYWLIDIYLFIHQHDKEIDYGRFLKLVKHFGFERSLSFTKKLLSKYCALEWESIKTKDPFPLKDQFLIEDSQRHWYYLSLKWYLKNGLKTNFRYSIAWLKARSF